MLKESSGPPIHEESPKNNIKTDLSGRKKRREGSRSSKHSRKSSLISKSNDSIRESAKKTVKYKSNSARKEKNSSPSRYRETSEAIPKKKILKEPRNKQNEGPIFSTQGNI